MAIYIPIVNEADYPALKNLCQRNVVGIDFEHFMRMVAEVSADAKGLTVVVKRTPIDTVALEQWLGGRKASKSDLFQFADHSRTQSMLIAMARNNDRATGKRLKKINNSEI